MSLEIRPIHVTIPVACQITGESRAGLYNAMARGELTAVKAGVRRTMLIYSELERRCAARPTGLRKENPALAAARDEAIARRKKQVRRKRKSA
jgi:hypothetical protein